MGRKQWFALDVYVFDSDLGVGIRDRFGVAGLAMWVGFLAACKRNIVPGKIRYSSDAECLSIMGLTGLELVDEEGAAFTLDDFWRHLGQHKQTNVTRSKQLVDVRATRWEQWQNDARTDRERERKRRSRSEDARTENGRSADALRSKSGPTETETETVKNPLPPQSGGSSKPQPDHHGQHANCRACGTNPRGPRQPDPTERHLRAIEGELERNAQRLRGEACEKCAGSGWVDVETDHGPSVARCTTCEDSATERVRQAMNGDA